jgi:hypothetical protein
LGTPPVPREIPFRADSIGHYGVKIGNKIASARAFPSATWERGNHGKEVALFTRIVTLIIIKLGVIMGKGNNSQKKETKKPKKEKPKVLATRKTN